MAMITSSSRPTFTNELLPAVHEEIARLPEKLPQLFMALTK